MSSSDRVLRGRPSRLPGDSWSIAKAAVAQRPAAEEPYDPMADPAVLAVIAGTQQQAAERGYADGRAVADQQLAGIIAAAQGMARALETAVPRDVEMVARTVAELAVLISRRILAAELRHDPAVLVAAIEAGLRQAAGASVITVELHPTVVDAVQAAWTARHGSRHRGFTWSFSADPTLPVGGCRLRTEHGFVEAGFEDQLAEVAASLDASIPGYIGSALGPAADAAPAPAPSQPAAVPGLAPATAAGIAPVAHIGSPAPAAAADPVDLDIAALATLGLDLGPEELA